MSKKIILPNKNAKGFGYVGVWNSPPNELGWFLPPHLSDRKYPSINRNENSKGARFFLCEIKIKLIKDKKGRPITKINK